MWEFGLGYGAAWCGLIFMFMAIILLICDGTSDEMFYKEKDVEVHDDDDDSSSDEENSESNSCSE